MILVCVMKNDAFLNGEVGKQQKLCRCRKIKLKKPHSEGTTKQQNLQFLRCHSFSPAVSALYFAVYFPNPSACQEGSKHFSDLLSWFKKKISLSYTFPLQTEDIGWALL